MPFQLNPPMTSHTSFIDRAARRFRLLAEQVGTALECLRLPMSTRDMTFIDTDRAARLQADATLDATTFVMDEETFRAF